MPELTGEHAATSGSVEPRWCGSPPGSAFASPIGPFTTLAPHLYPLWATSRHVTSLQRHVKPFCAEFLGQRRDGARRAEGAGGLATGGSAKTGQAGHVRARRRSGQGDEN